MEYTKRKKVQFRHSHVTKRIAFSDIFFLLSSSSYLILFLLPFVREDASILAVKYCEIFRKGLFNCSSTDYCVSWFAYCVSAISKWRLRLSESFPISMSQKYFSFLLFLRSSSFLLISGMCLNGPMHEFSNLATHKILRQKTTFRWQRSCEIRKRLRERFQVYPKWELKCLVSTLIILFMLKY